MLITHAKSLTVSPATGTLTIWNGGTTSSIAASDVIQPNDWNSQHALSFVFGGNTTNISSVSGTQVPFAATGGVSIGASNGSLLISAPVCPRPGPGPRGWTRRPRESRRCRIRICANALRMCAVFDAWS